MCDRSPGIVSGIDALNAARAIIRSRAARKANRANRSRSIVLIGPIRGDKRPSQRSSFGDGRSETARDDAGAPGVRCHGCPVSFANTPNNKSVSRRSFSSAALLQVVPPGALL